jgi:2-polyprenyl-3-methyl-5-hydroxy-6-metoxy-1,4-benzoquinol methylase
LGGNQVTISALEKVWSGFDKSQELTIVDLGCGSGEMLRIISNLAKAENRKVKLTGIDANPNIVQYAVDHSNNFENIFFRPVDIFSEDFQKEKFDIVIATLFFHHFSNEELVRFLFQLVKQINKAVIVNDIHRHAFAFYSIKWLTYYFSKSNMVKYDAPLSVRRAFKRNELESILEKAGIRNYQLKWKWAFRWQLIIIP